MKDKLLILFFTLIVASVAAFAQPVKQITNNQIKQIIAEVNPNINIGIKVVDLNDHKIIYQLNPDKNFIPGSNLKLFTYAATFLHLGPNFRFQTDLLTTAAAVKDGTLLGNLYIKFSGDPALNHSDLTKLIHQLKRYNIHRIKGNLVLDTSVFLTQPYGPGWMIDDVRYSYGAALTPLILDFNATSVNVNPAAQVGKKAVISLSSPSYGITLNNQLTTMASDHKDCHVSYKMNNKNILTLKGCLKINNNGYNQAIAIRNPLLYGQNALRDILKQQGITLEGKIVTGKTPTKAKLLATHLSPSLFDLLVGTPRPPENILAESLFLKLGAVYFQKPGTWENGSKALKAILYNQAGVDLSTSVIVDGSGLSRYNLVNSAQIVKLLAYMYQDFPLTDEYISMLPVKTEVTQALQNRVRSKLGGMKGVSSLTGYLNASNHHKLAFAIMIDGYSGAAAKYIKLEDQLLHYFVQHPYPNEKSQQSMKIPITSTNATNKQQSARKQKPLLTPRVQQLALVKQITKVEIALRQQLANRDVTMLRQQNTFRLILPGEQTFSLDSATIKANALTTLKTIATSLKPLQNVVIVVAGFTSDTGKVKLNQSNNCPQRSVETNSPSPACERGQGVRVINSLSYQRAENVTKVLQQSGVKPEKILTIGYGEQDPLDANAKGRVMNRRVEIRIQFQTNK